MSQAMRYRHPRMYIPCPALRFLPHVPSQAGVMPKTGCKDWSHNRFHCPSMPNTCDFPHTRLLREVE